MPANEKEVLKQCKWNACGEVFTYYEINMTWFNSIYYVLYRKVLITNWIALNIFDNMLATTCG